MLLFDVNVLVYAHREDANNHLQFRRFIETVLTNDSSFGYSTQVLSGFLRVVAHPKVFNPPSPLMVATEFCQQIVDCPNALPITNGSRHWSIFLELCSKVDAKGNLIPDAFFAALAIESGCTWVTTDRDFSRFPGLDWKHPLTDF